MYNIVSLGNHRFLGKQNLSIEKKVEYELLAECLEDLFHEKIHYSYFG